MREEREKVVANVTASETALGRLISGATKFKNQIREILNTLKPTSEIASKFHSKVIKIGFPSAVLSLSGIALYYLGAPSIITHPMIVVGGLGAYLPHTLTAPEYVLSVAEKVNEKDRKKSLDPVV